MTPEEPRKPPRPAPKQEPTPPARTDIHGRYAPSGPSGPTSSGPKTTRKPKRTSRLSSILRLGPLRSSNLAPLLIDILRHLGRRSKLRPAQIQPVKLITRSEEQTSE